MMFVYYCWITALLPSYQDGIITGLVRKGYMVSAVSKEGEVICPTDYDRPASALIALSVYKFDEINADGVYRDVCDIIYDMKAPTYSVVVAVACDCCWAGPNFELPANTLT